MWTWDRWQWRGTLPSPKLLHYWNLTIRLFCVISRTIVGASYHPVEIQSVCSTAPADSTSRALVEEGLTPLQRYTRWILQTQPNGSPDECCRTLMKERWHRKKFITKIYVSSLFLEKSEIDYKCEWETETGRWRTLTETGGGLLYWPFLNPRCDSIFTTLRLCFLNERSKQGSAIGPLGLSGHLLATLQTSWLPDRLTDWPWLSVWYLCIYDFITPISSSCPSGSQPPWSAYTHASSFSSNHFVYTARTPRTRNPWLPAFWRSICNTSSEFFKNIRMMIFINLMAVKVSKDHTYLG